MIYYIYVFVDIRKQFNFGRQPLWIMELIIAIPCIFYYTYIFFYIRINYLRIQIESGFSFSRVCVSEVLTILITSRRRRRRHLRLFHYYYFFFHPTRQSLVFFSTYINYFNRINSRLLRKFFFLFLFAKYTYFKHRD